MSRRRAKAQGTAHESGAVRYLKDLGIADARRLPEAGSLDEGDVAFTLDRQSWVMECKATQTLNVQAVLGKTRAKAKGRPVIVWWRRLVAVPGASRRQPVAGERDVLIISPADFFAALEQARAQARADHPTPTTQKDAA